MPRVLEDVHGWLEELHPRDKHGRWINKGENVQLHDGSIGKVVGSHKGDNGHANLIVRRGDGTTVSVSAKQTAVTAKAPTHTPGISVARTTPSGVPGRGTPATPNNLVPGHRVAVAGGRTGSVTTVRPGSGTAIYAEDGSGALRTTQINRLTHLGPTPVSMGDAATARNLQPGHRVSILNQRLPGRGNNYSVTTGTVTAVHVNPGGVPMAQYTADGSGKTHLGRVDRMSHLGLSSSDRNVPAPVGGPPPRIHTPIVADEARAAMITQALKENANLATDKQFFDPKTKLWSEDRIALQNQIIDDLYAKAANVPNDRKAIIAGGLPGAGKTTILNGHAKNASSSEFLTLNPDVVKEELINRGMAPQVPGLTPMESVALIHQESSDITQRLAQRAYGDGKNVIWDITMGSPDSISKRLTALKANNYSTRGIFVSTTMDKSLSNALNRWQGGIAKYNNGEGLGGRFVPASVSQEAASTNNYFRSKNEDTFSQMRRNFDDWELWDNRDNNPTLVTNKSMTLRSGQSEADPIPSLPNGPEPGVSTPNEPNAPPAPDVSAPAVPAEATAPTSVGWDANRQILHAGDTVSYDTPQGTQTGTITRQSIAGIHVTDSQGTDRVMRPSQLTKSTPAATITDQHAPEPAAPNVVHTPTVTDTAGNTINPGDVVTHPGGGGVVDRITPSGNVAIRTSSGVSMVAPEGITLRPPSQMAGLPEVTAGSDTPGTQLLQTRRRMAEMAARYDGQLSNPARARSIRDLLNADDFAVSSNGVAIGTVDGNLRAMSVGNGAPLRPSAAPNPSSNAELLAAFEQTGIPFGDHEALRARWSDPTQKANDARAVKEAWQLAGRPVAPEAPAATPGVPTGGDGTPLAVGQRVTWGAGVTGEVRMVHTIGNNSYAEVRGDDGRARMLPAADVSQAGAAAPSTPAAPAAPPDRPYGEYPSIGDTVTAPGGEQGTVLEVTPSVTRQGDALITFRNPRGGVDTARLSAIHAEATAGTPMDANGATLRPGATVTWPNSGMRTGGTGTISSIQAARSWDTVAPNHTHNVNITSTEGDPRTLPNHRLTAWQPTVGAEIMHNGQRGTVTRVDQPNGDYHGAVTYKTPEGLVRAAAPNEVTAAPPPLPDISMPPADPSEFRRWGARSAEIASTGGPNLLAPGLNLRQAAQQEAFKNALTDLYNGPEGGLGKNKDYKATITGVSHYGSALQYQGRIVAPDGGSAGSFTRTVHFKNGKIAEIHNDLMSLTPDHQGQGIARDLYRRQENWAIRNGIPKITVQANINVGGYTWGRLGYDWKSKRDGRTFATNMVSTLRRGGRRGGYGRMDVGQRVSGPNGRTGTVTEITDSWGTPRYSVNWDGGQPETGLRHYDISPVVDESSKVFQDVQAIQAKMAADPKYVPTPYELGQIGYTPGQTTWPGKEYMLGTNWYGVKRLNPRNSQVNFSLNEFSESRFTGDSGKFYGGDKLFPHGHKMPKWDELTKVGKVRVGVLHPEEPLHASQTHLDHGKLRRYEEMKPNASDHPENPPKVFVDRKKNKHVINGHHRILADRRLGRYTPAIIVSALPEPAPAPAAPAVTAGAEFAWLENLHPRDKNGKFISKGGFVTLKDGSTGKVVGSSEAKDGTALVHVKRDNGTSTTVAAHTTTAQAQMPGPYGKMRVVHSNPRVPAGDLMKSIKDNGGFTYDPRRGGMMIPGHDQGFAVAVPGTEQIIGNGTVSRQAFAKGVAKVLIAHRDQIRAGAMLGGWYSEDRNAYMVELTDILPQSDRAAAIAEGTKRNQEGIFDIGNAEYIATGGTGG